VRAGSHVPRCALMPLLLPAHAPEPACLYAAARGAWRRRQVQRLKQLEEIYSELIAQRTGAPPPPPQHDVQRLEQAPTSDHQQALPPLYGTTTEAVIAEGGASRGEWAAAANVSVAELRTQLREGRLARERIVVSNMGLVGSLVQKLKRSSGGRLDQGITEADLMQEVCATPSRTRGARASPKARGYHARREHPVRCGAGVHLAAACGGAL
jgi:hypothetical protein